MNMQISPIAECVPSQEIPKIRVNEDCSGVDNPKNNLCSSRLFSKPLDGSTMTGDSRNRLWPEDNVFRDGDVCRLGELNDESNVVTGSSTNSNAMETASSQKRFTHSRSASDFGITLQSANRGDSVDARQCMSHSLSAEPSYQLIVECE